ncbi:unnamed protein product [Nesidiocoris tenuis]|uniref:Uncharacterized protein n=1 Tax=Nesidiocoris tenuis TaxID=355587 RepID=A0A6H5H835_9HEMI|nr:unnamed protein product [Nesidiocoris tenuis]
MHRNHQQLRDIRKRCVKAKQELSTNLYHRLNGRTMLRANYAPFIPKKSPGARCSKVNSKAISCHPCSEDWKIHLRRSPRKLRHFSTRSSPRLKLSLQLGWAPISTQRCFSPLRDANLCLLTLLILSAATASEKREADLEKRLKLLMEENEILASRAEQLENELSAQQQNVQDVTTRHKVEIEAITSRYKLYSQSIDRSCVHEKMESARHHP